MKNIAIKTGIAAFALLCVSACSDFLDPENRENVDTDKYFSTTEGISSGTTEAYYSLRNVYGGDVSMFIAGTDIYGKGRSGYCDAQLQEYKDIPTDHSKVLDFYKNCYSGIQQCNLIIGKASADQASYADQCRVIRAYYYYLLSQQFGGVPLQTEYINEANKNYPRATLQEVYDFIFAELQEVLDNGNLPATDHTGRISQQFVNNILAKTYLAAGWDLQTTCDVVSGKVQSQSSREYFQQAAKYADAAIGGATPSLTFANQWLTANENNADEIFAIQYTRGISSQDEIGTGNSQMCYFGNYYVEDKNDMTAKYTNSQAPANNKLIYLFEPGDTRWEGTFMVERLKRYMHSLTGISASDTTYYWYPAWYELGDNPTTTSVKTVFENWRNENVSDGHIRTTAKIYTSSDPSFVQDVTVNKRSGKITYKTITSQTYQTSLEGTGTSLCIKKFDDAESTISGTSKVSYRNIVLAHLTETYLIAAEAYYMAGDEATSLKRLNVVRNRAFEGASGELTSYGSYVRHYTDGKSVQIATGLDVIDVILDERARELCGEYYRWMDLRRTRKLIPYNVENNPTVTGADDAFLGNDGKYKLYRPFPQAEINLNDAISDSDQNDGYKDSSAE